MTSAITRSSALTTSAVELAARLDLPKPTPQQVAVIEAPLTPALVVAGAGSGKTETMANRVVWLVANGLVGIDEVLGLTFTRKAAGELAERITRRLAQLQTAGVVPGSSEFSGGSADSELHQATVSTYNAFANSLFRENALLIGREPESVLLNDSSAWQLARRVVTEHGDERLVGLEKSVDTVTTAVLELSHEISENVADPASVIELATRFTSLVDLPITDGRAKSTPYKPVIDAVGAVSALDALVELAERFSLEKRRRGLVEFSDQVAFALEIATRVPSMAQSYRDRYRVVLLDEYQDTSTVQTRLLAALFAGHGVMAVGDPNQAIYGWRGASAGNLALFPRDFAGATDSQHFALSTSWRNATSILDAANVTVEEFRVRQPELVEVLEPRPGADAGHVTVSYSETILEEAMETAEWLKARLAEPTLDKPSAQQQRSAAILFRNRRHMSLFATELDRIGVKNQILGLGGLLSTPEIVDLVSVLRVVSDPAAGSELIRVLGGARYSVGIRDLKQLSNVAGWLSRHDWAQAPLADEVAQKLRDSVESDEARSIVDALDFVAHAKPGHSQLAGFSEEGLARLTRAGRQLSFLRSRGGLGLSDFVRLVEQEFLLDVEVAANPHNALAFANLEAFHDEIVNFLAVDDIGSLGSFLHWLDRVAKRDTMGPRSDAAVPGTVQLLTIHGSKGLEWDAVVVPRLVAGELPSSSREGTGWVRFGKLPYDFRGDRDHLPSLAWQQQPTQRHLKDELERFAEALKVRHQDEERRLAYVAFTRARHDLLLTGSYWAGSTAREPSIFLAELASAELVRPLPEGTALPENPAGHEEREPNWPMDPLGSRRTVVSAAADLVRGADPTATGRWARDLELLLEERRQRLAASDVVELPARVPASRFKDFVSTPAEVAASLRRPMPERPYRATRLGTLFHAWVEQRLGVGGTAETIDAFGFELDDPDGGTAVQPLDEERTALDALIRTFEQSPWAARAAVEVEREIHLPFDGRIVVCKIDAVFEHGGRFEIVDWKTGKAPKDAADLESKQLQLALYRQAFAEWKAIDPALVDAVFYYVTDDRIIRPEHLYERAELEQLWRGVTGGV